MSFRLLFRSLHFLALVFATISLVSFGVQEKMLEKIAVSVFRCSAVSWLVMPSAIMRSILLKEPIVHVDRCKGGI